MKGSIHSERIDRSVADFIWTSLTASVTVIQLRIQAVLNCNDIESLHQFRVGVRRLRSDLRSFRPIIDHDWVDSVREKLKWFDQFTTPIRDGDVMLERLARNNQKLDFDLDPNQVWRIRAQLTEEISQARNEFYEALASDHCATLMSELLSWGEGSTKIFGPHKDLKRILQILNSSSWQRVRMAIKEQKSDPSDAHMHRVRIIVKRARYLADACVPILGKPAKRHARDLESLQAVLGELQDSSVMSKWLRGLDSQTQADGPTVRILLELEATHRFQLRRQYRRILRSIRD
jgi:CHAD domain-containing protein